MSPSTRLSLLLYFILLIAFLTSSQMITSLSLSFKVDAAADEGGLVSGRISNITLIADDHAIMRISPDNQLHPGGIEYKMMTFKKTAK